MGYNVNVINRKEKINPIIDHYSIDTINSDSLSSTKSSNSSDRLTITKEPKIKILD